MCKGLVSLKLAISEIVKIATEPEIISNHPCILSPLTCNGHTRTVDSLQYPPHECLVELRTIDLNSHLVMSGKHCRSINSYLEKQRLELVHSGRV